MSLKFLLAAPNRSEMDGSSIKKNLKGAPNKPHMSFKQIPLITSELNKLELVLSWKRELVQSIQAQQPQAYKYKFH